MLVKFFLSNQWKNFELKKDRIWTSQYDFFTHSLIHIHRKKSNFHFEFLSTNINVFFFEAKQIHLYKHNLRWNGLMNNSCLKSVGQTNKEKEVEGKSEKNRNDAILENYLFIYTFPLHNKNLCIAIAKNQTPINENNTFLQREWDAKAKFNVLRECKILKFYDRFLNSIYHLLEWIVFIFIINCCCCCWFYVRVDIWFRKPLTMSDWQNWKPNIWWEFHEIAVLFTSK